jgi:transcriptional regulator with XRE-family HTH domain
MPAKGQTRLVSGGQLALFRHRAGISQVELARRMGLSIATYQRLEEGRITNPPLGYLVNAAIVLDVPLAWLIEPEWLTWWDLSGSGIGSSKPTREAHWGEPPAGA